MYIIGQKNIIINDVYFFKMDVLLKKYYSTTHIINNGFNNKFCKFEIIDNLTFIFLTLQFIT